MEQNDYLLFPLDNFWVSYPYCSYGRKVALGTIKSKEVEVSIKSPGKGTVLHVNKKSVGYEVITLHRNGLNYVRIRLSPVTEVLVEKGDNIKQGQIIGKVREPHLEMIVHVGKKVSDLKITNPMTILYLHPHQRNGNNIPYHTPRPLPRRFIGT